jgi:DNA-binding transcriptional LysR family regulator
LRTENAVQISQATVRGRLGVAAPMVFGACYLDLAPILYFVRHYSEFQLDVEYDDRRVNLQEEGVDVAVRIG